MKRLLIALALLASACATSTPPPATPSGPPSVPATVRVAITVLDPARQSVPGLTCALELDTLEGEPQAPTLSCAYDGLQATFGVAPNYMHRGANLTLSAPGYADVSDRVVTEPDILERTMRLAARQAGESGWVRRDGPRFVTETDATWQWRGSTAFWLAKRVCDGESIEGYLNSDTGPIAKGANVLRVLGMFNGGLGRFVPSDYPDYIGCIARTRDILKAHSIRMEFVVFADAQNILKDTQAQREHLARMASLDDWNIFFELVNEYPQNGVDPAAFSKPSTRALWSRGSGLGDGDPALPAWDFLTHHSARVDEWPRRIECREYTNNGASPALGTPCVEDEPYGAAETRFPGRRVGIEALDDMRQWGAVCGLHAVGCTFHSDGGILAQPWGEVQQRLADAFFFGMRWVPPDAQVWPYQRGEANGGAGVGNMPLEHTDALALRTWCKTAGNQSWCVAVKPQPGWVARPRDGWRVLEEPARGLVKLVR